tara:strand:- start:356 stop:697 length:342 start_codon:yes stop_codon:yes gene_type:complete
MVAKLLLAAAVLVPVVDAAGFAPDAMPLGLVALVVGLVWGVMSPSDDVATRTAFYVLAFALPTIADHLDVIPVAGAYANGFLDSFAVVIAGVAVANVFMQLKDKLMAAFAPGS